MGMSREGLSSRGANEVKRTASRRGWRGRRHRRSQRERRCTSSRVAPELLTVADIMRFEKFNIRKDRARVEAMGCTTDETGQAF